MRLAQCMFVAAIAATVPAGPIDAQVPEAASMAGLISELSGAAQILAPRTGAAQPASRFDAIVAGSTLVTTARSRAVVVLVNGQRFELGPEARATITDASLARRSGPVSELPRLPTLPRLVALDESRPTGSGGSVRLRGEVIQGLRPSYTVVASQPVSLRFAPISNAGRYSVRVDDVNGRMVFGVETTSAEAIVPAEVLQPGARYLLTVETAGRIGGEARGMSEFTTLSAEDARARETLRRTLGIDSGSAAIALAAEVDRRLGLRVEALAGFRAALALSPNDAAIQRVVAQLEE